MNINHLCFLTLEEITPEEKADFHAFFSENPKYYEGFKKAKDAAKTPEEKQAMLDNLRRLTGHHKSVKEQASRQQQRIINNNSQQSDKSSFFNRHWGKMATGAGVIGAAAVGGKLLHNKLSKPNFIQRNKKKLAIGGGAAAGALAAAVGTKALLKHLRKKKEN